MSLETIRIHGRILVCILIRIHGASLYASLYASMGQRALPAPLVVFPLGNLSQRMPPRLVIWKGRFRFVRMAGRPPQTVALMRMRPPCMSASSMRAAYLRECRPAQCKPGKCGDESGACCTAACCIPSGLSVTREGFV